MDISVFAVLGGDMRSAVLASLLAAEGYTVFAAGFDSRPELIQCAALTDAYTAASMAQAAILPVMPTTDGAMLFAPMSVGSIPIDERLCKALEHKLVYTGFADRVKRAAEKYGSLELRDYGRRESFLLPNARLTAEAAVMMAVETCPLALYDCKCLITGCGRVGKALAQMLGALGADVTVCARKAADLAFVRSTGLTAIDYIQLAVRAGEYDIAFNTADALVIGENVIRRMKKDARIIDLASAPGGTDFAAAERYGIAAETAPGLPGKYSPVTAAKIIRDTVLAMTGEENA